MILIPLAKLLSLFCMSKSHFPVSIRESTPISFDEFLPKDFPENVGADLTKSVSGMLTGGMLLHPSNAKP